jgi:ribosomal protein L40E
MENTNEKLCVKCGASINSEAEICPKCGVRQPVQAAMSAPSNSRPASPLKIVGLVLAVVAVVVFGLFFLPGLLYGDEHAANELISTASSWSKLQRAYNVETGTVGNFEQISYTPPGNGESKYFDYTTEIENGFAFWKATSKKKLGKCPAGSKWILGITYLSTEIALKRWPQEKACQELTPKYNSIR